MPFRRKTRNPVSRPEKENEGIGADQPLSPRLIRCKSDNTRRTCLEINLNKSSGNNGNLSPEAKMSNLMQLNAALIKEISSLRHSHADSCDKFSKLESSLCAENEKLELNLSSLQEEASALKEENAALLASQEELQSSLGTSRAQVEGLSLELAMIKEEVNESLSSQKQALSASEERLASATAELNAAKENVSLITSEKDSLLMSKAETEEKLEGLYKRENELEKLLQVEKKAVADSQEIISTVRNDVEKLLVDKEDYKQQCLARENEAMQKMQQLEERLNACTTKANSLTLQIEEERAVHAEAMKSGQEESASGLSELSAELLAAKEHLQQSRYMVKTLNMQNEKERTEHQAGITNVMEKLKNSSQKIRETEELLHVRDSSIEVLRKQITENSAKHHGEVNSLQENISAMAIEVSSLSENNQKLQAKKEDLHKELSRVNQKYRATSEQLVKERKAMSEVQKSVQVLQQEVTQLQVVKEESLKEVDHLKVDLSQCYALKAALLSEKETLLSEKVALERDISSLTKNGLKLFNERQDDQRVHAEERQRLVTELKTLAGTVSDLEIEQSDLLKQLNVEKMSVAAAQEKIAALESSKDALLRENFSIKVAHMEQLRSNETEMASLHHEEQRLCQINSKLYEQVACTQQERDNALVEKDKAVAKLVESDVRMLELSSAKKAVQQTLEEEKSNAQRTISSLKNEIASLEKSRDQLIHDSVSARTEAEAVAEDNKQLSMDLTLVQGEKTQLELLLFNLREELVEASKRAEVASVVLAKQHSDMEQLQIEVSELATANSELLSTIEMHEDQGKLLMLDNEKKAEQITFLSKLSAELEVSHSALQAKMAKQKAAFEAFESDNAVLQSSIEAKAKAILALERQVEDSAKRTIALESQIEAMSKVPSVLELRVKNLQEDSIAQNAALDAEKHEKFYLQSTLEDRDLKIQSLEKQLVEAAEKISMVESQLETSNKKQADLDSAINAVTEELAKANTAAIDLQDQTKANLDCLLCENNEIGNLKTQSDEAIQANTDVIMKLKICSEEKGKLEPQFRNVEAELANAKGEVLKAEKELLAAGKREGEFKEASKRVSLLEAQLTAKATMQNELEFQVISLQNDLQAARAASATAEKDWKANMEAMRENANARSRTLEEQLESVKKTLDEMQNSTNKGQESIGSLQDQLSCLMEEKSSLERKVSLFPRALEAEEPNYDEPKVGDMKVQKRLDDKAKFVRLALPVFLISAASSLVIAGIQSYMKKLEN
ncbi:hypothetical protein GOP47_0025200 [Adiantum capillus-veneris]|uniref:Uncharacterized protein n=1 Tax=Adiantum capillus-veneris TaxID=13818 RepID=A0A9D4U479_ADICA|nr:hypothetical protein GOP47_0025200 [Adiantum capillus-veneris]